MKTTIIIIIFIVIDAVLIALVYRVYSILLKAHGNRAGTALTATKPISYCASSQIWGLRPENCVCCFRWITSTAFMWRCHGWTNGWKRLRQSRRNIASDNRWSGCVKITGAVWRIADSPGLYSFSVLRQDTPTLVSMKMLNYVWSLLPSNIQKTIVNNHTPCESKHDSSGRLAYCVGATYLHAPRSTLHYRMFDENRIQYVLHW